MTNPKISELLGIDVESLDKETKKYEAAAAVMRALSSATAILVRAVSDFHDIEIAVHGLDQSPGVREEVFQPMAKMCASISAASLETMRLLQTSELKASHACEEARTRVSELLGNPDQHTISEYTSIVKTVLAAREHMHVDKA